MGLQLPTRLKIGFFDYPDVFEDFYSHYGVDQKTFATRWHNTGSHAWLKIIQEEIGDIIWYSLSLKPEITEPVTHEYFQGKVRFLSSSFLHRWLWKFFYTSKISWRLKKYYRIYAALASYSALLSWNAFKAIKADKPDVILVQEYCSGKFDILYLYAKILRIPIMTYHAGSTDSSFSGKWLRHLTLKRTDWIYASGESEKAKLQKEYEVSQSRVNIIRPPVDMAIYKPLNKDNACEEIGLKAGNRYWLYVGRFDDSVKRISSIINTFCLVAENKPSLNLLIIGGGNDDKKLINLVPENLKGRILFIGWVADDFKKSLFYNSSECLLMASVREGFPTVIGEAFACGVPVIASDVGAIADLVTDEKTGWLFPAGDEEAMLKIYQSIANDPAKALKLQPEVRKVAEENVSFEAVARALKEGFYQISSSKYE